MHRYAPFVAALFFGAAACQDKPADPASSASTSKEGGEGKGKGKGKGKEKEKKEPGEASAKKPNADGPQKGDLGARVDAEIEKAMTELHVPGVSVTVVRDGAIVVQKGYGFADLEAKKPMTIDTTLGLASVTKVFTAIGVLVLVDQGKVKLDDPYSKYVTDCPATWKAITVRQMLAMQSGIPSPPQSAPMADWKAAIAWAAAKPLKFTPGTKTFYSNPTFLALGHLIESVSGKPYEAFITASVLGPAGMTSTRLNTEPPPDGRAVNYLWDKGQFTHAPPHAWSFSSGGLVSNQVDLAKLDAAIRAGKILTAGSWEAMFTAQPLADGSAAPRGLGWDFVRLVGGKKRAGKAGDLPGWKTSFLHASEEGVTVILLANAHDKKLNGVAQRIFHMALGVEGAGKNEKEPPVEDAPDEDEDPL